MAVHLEPLFEQHLDEIKRRVTAALEASGFDGVLVLAGLPPAQPADDQHYPYKPNPQFKLWIPDPQPGCVVSFRAGSRPRLIFHRPVDFWYQPPGIPADGWCRSFDIEVVEDTSAARRAATATGRWALLGERDAAWDALGTWNPPALLARLDYARAAKTPYEVECIAQASRLGARAHRAAERAFREGASEYEVHLAYCGAVAVREEELPYNSIVAFNEHAAVLHYQRLDRSRPATRRSFLIDAGAPFRGYASDITRTYAGGPGAFADLVSALDGLQQRVAAGVRPGRDFRDVHLDAHLELGALLADAGLVRSTADQAVARGLTRVFFPHGIGHLLGLQVHDVGGLMAGPGAGERPRPAGHPWLRLTRDLPPGCVVTIEPGLYFIESLLAEAAGDGRRRLIDWDAVEQLRGCGGIRIEDDVVALPEGPRNLTREAFAAVS